MDYLCWDIDTDTICKQIRSEKATLKIVLKTKNDIYFLKKWILHHKSIIGDAKLIIFDNMSDRESVYDIYERHKDILHVFHYSGHHNRIHSRNEFRPLYEALVYSSVFYAFIDTDEFLYLYDGRKIINNNIILKYLHASKDVGFFSTYFLENIQQEDNIFYFGDLLNIQRSLLDGKPIINSKQNNISRIVENVVGAHTYGFYGSIKCFSPLCFLLLHRKNISIEQRLFMNMQKLYSYNLISNQSDFKTVLSIDYDKIPKYTLGYFYIKEIQDLLNSRDATLSNKKKEKTIQINENGTVQFFSETTKDLFKTWVSSKADLFDILSLKISNQEKDKTLWQIWDEQKDTPRNVNRSWEEWTEGMRRRR